MKKIGTIFLIFTTFLAIKIQSMSLDDLEELLNEIPKPIENIISQGQKYGIAAQAKNDLAQKQARDSAIAETAQLNNKLEKYFTAIQTSNKEDRNYLVQTLQHYITTLIKGGEIESEGETLNIEGLSNQNIDFQYIIVSSAAITGDRSFIKNLQKLTRQQVFQEDQENLSSLRKILGTLVYYVVAIYHLNGLNTKQSLDTISISLKGLENDLAITDEDINTELSNLQNRIEQAMPFELLEAIPEDMLGQYLTYLLQTIMQLNPFIQHEAPFVAWSDNNIFSGDAGEFLSTLSENDAIKQILAGNPISLIAMAVAANKARKDTIGKISQSITDATANNTIINGKEVLNKLDPLDIVDEEKITYKFMKEKVENAIKILDIAAEAKNVDAIDLSPQYLGISNNTSPIAINNIFVGKGVANTLQKAIYQSRNLLTDPKTLEITDIDELWVADYIKPTKKYLEFSLTYTPDLSLADLEKLKADFDAFESQVQNLEFFKAFIEDQLKNGEIYLGTALDMSIAILSAPSNAIKEALKASYEAENLKPKALQTILDDITEKTIEENIKQDAQGKYTKEEMVFLNKLIKKMEDKLLPYLNKQKVTNALEIFGILNKDLVNFDDLKKEAENFNPDNFQYSKGFAQALYNFKVKAYQILTAPKAPGNPLDEISLFELNIPDFHDQFNTYAAIAAQVKDGLPAAELNKLKTDLENLENSLGNKKDDFIAFIQGLKYNDTPEIYLMDTIKALIKGAGPQVSTEELNKLLNELTINLMALSQLLPAQQ